MADNEKTCNTILHVEKIEIYYKTLQNVQVRPQQNITYLKN